MSISAGGTCGTILGAGLITADAVALASKSGIGPACGLQLATNTLTASNTTAGAVTCDSSIAERFSSSAHGRILRGGEPSGALSSATS